MSGLVFGVDRDPGTVQVQRTRDNCAKTNPMPIALGPGPEGRRCRECVHLITYQMGKRWFKCDLREHSNSTRTDHRALWPTCAKFEPTAERGIA